MSTTQVPALPALNTNVEIGSRTYQVVRASTSGSNTRAATRGSSVGDLILRRGKAIHLATLRQSGAVTLDGQSYIDDGSFDA